MFNLLAHQEFHPRDSRFFLVSLIYLTFPVLDKNYQLGLMLFSFVCTLDYWVSMRSKWVAVVGVAVLLLCYYNLLRSIPEHHDAMLRENFRLSLQVQERAQQRIDHSNASDIPFPPTNTLPGQSNQPELDAQIEEKNSVWRRE